VALLMWGVSRCSICRELLVQGQPIMATTHFIGDPADHLSRFSDTGMHAACFAGWEHRDEFAARYHAALGVTLAGWVPAVPANPGGTPLPRFGLGGAGHARGAGRVLRCVAGTQRPGRRTRRCSRPRLIGCFQG
jgi:hypothetical protein